MIGQQMALASTSSPLAQCTSCGRQQILGLPRCTAFQSRQQDVLRRTGSGLKVRAEKSLCCYAFTEAALLHAAHPVVIWHPKYTYYPVKLPSFVDTPQPLGIRCCGTRCDQAGTYKRCPQRSAACRVCPSHSDGADLARPPQCSGQ